jgi:hypothetical protein
MVVEKFEYKPNSYLSERLIRYNEIIPDGPGVIVTEGFSCNAKDNQKHHYEG